MGQLSEHQKLQGYMRKCTNCWTSPFSHVYEIWFRYL